MEYILYSSSMRVLEQELEEGNPSCRSVRCTPDEKEFSILFIYSGT